MCNGNQLWAQFFVQYHDSSYHCTAYVLPLFACSTVCRKAPPYWWYGNSSARICANSSANRAAEIGSSNRSSLADPPESSLVLLVCSPTFAAKPVLACCACNIWQDEEFVSKSSLYISIQSDTSNCFGSLPSSLPSSRQLCDFTVVRVTLIRSKSIVDMNSWIAVSL